MQGHFWKRFYGAWNGAGPKGHTMPEIARGARPAGSGKPAALLPGARMSPQVPPARTKQSAVLPREGFV